MKAVIGLDPGHGGSSSGTYSVNTTKDGLFEKDFALELSLMIEERLLKNGFGVVITRRTDINPGTVVERAAKMVANNVDFALSVHFNGFGTESANGTEVFVPYGEHLAGIETGFHEVLTKYFRERKPFARSNNYYDRNATFDKKLNLGTRRFDAVSSNLDYFGFVRNCWQAGISADLLEICFLTNKADFDSYIKNKEAIADGLAKSIVEAFGEKYVALNAVEPEKPPIVLEPVVPEEKPKKVIKRPKTKTDVLN